MAIVREMMTGNPESVDAQAMVGDAAKVMREMNVGSVPVVSEGRVAGIVTDRDIAVRVIAENRNPTTVRVADVATANPLTIGPEAAVEEAARLMAQHQVRRLPVVEDGRLIGMLSLGDVSVEGNREQAGKALKEISTPARPER
ncbi:MAG: CBS domain-containing protein [Dehalococcoidia bacterium]